MKTLIVEDETITRLTFEKHLKRLGHRVTSCSDAESALTAYQQTFFPLILLDIGLPKMDGLEATRVIREKEQATGEHIPIIALTAYAMEGDRERCLEAGMDDYIAKPIHAKRLLDTIGSTLSP